MRLFTSVLTIGFTLAAARPALAESYAFPINLPNGPLSSSLQGLARQSGAEFLFDANIVRARQAARLNGRLSVEAALQRLLAGTDLISRRASSGAWVVEQRPPPGASAPQDLAAPDILVIGRRTQDTDIRRRENDVQPYQVSTGDQVVRAHRDTLDQFFRSRVTANTSIAPSNLDGTGSTGSSIDLRGLGSDQTLILVDGRRMPGVPGSALQLGQPDINAIPLHAIDRVEMLTGTAGGIYGLGALGGVVNIILRHDYHGLELHGTTGISARGDARRLALEGGLGFTPDEGRTEVSVYVSHSWEQPLHVGQRRLAERQLDRLQRFAPETLIGDLDSDTLAISSDTGDALVLKPRYGGGSLGSGFSFARNPRNATEAALLAGLKQNAGQIDVHVPSDLKATDLIANPRTTSAMLNVRHRFGSGMEAYFDALILRNSGRYQDHQGYAQVSFSPESPLNPFKNYITATFAAPPSDDSGRTSYSSDRYTAGVIASLPFDWRINAEAIFGLSRYRTDTTIINYLVLGPFQATDTEPAAFSVDAFQRSVAGNRAAFTDLEISRNKYSEQSLRLAGPLFRTAAGASTLTLLLQNRTEKIPDNVSNVFNSFLDPPEDDRPYPGSHSQTRSIYGEIEAPLIRKDAGLPLINGLSLQLAIRHDCEKASFMLDPFADDPQRTRATFSGTMYTAGAKFYPLRWLMLRGSYATGQQPPPISDYRAVGIEEYLADLNDPKRRPVPISDSTNYLLLVGYSPDVGVRTVRASTLTLGMVLNPDGDHGPRISIDYSSTRRTGDNGAISADYIVAHEDEFPGRVVRDPLTDADRAAGDTAGVVRQIDARGLPKGHLSVRSIDMRLDWRVPLGAGFLRIYGSATRQLEHKQTGPAQEEMDTLGFVEGPLKWRANGGAEWTIGRTMIGANLQYFGRYRIVGSDYVDVAYVSERPQGSKYVKAQAFLDLYASRRFQVRWGSALHEASIDFAVVNLFDRAPAYAAGLNGLSFSSYGDTRQRRFELTLNTNF